ncbi:MAG: 2-amino-4-hydroxy-6-hydroxymethyldihydropteridine diphosphokinase [Acidobacteriota bacterium]|nr:2-amino-4-hydroxy-6-hydroxymethyldihydropteridine diphosphokinase [Acidobacteriota bacterium]
MNPRSAATADRLPPAATPVAIALGSNLGDRRRLLEAAIEALEPLLADLRVSTFYDTAPVGVAPQPRFLNAAASGTTRLPARDLLDRLLAIEAAAGRTRPHEGAARTLDLDLILYGGCVIDEPGLVVPHPRFRDRLFVLEPLAEVAPDAVDPVTGLTVRALRDRARTADAGC